MLTECQHCSQVIEIETITQHLLHECEKSKEFKECPRCKESIHQSDVVPPNEAGWKKHILEEICPKNPRKVGVKKK